MANKKVVLAYSGGLDTSVAIKWLQQKGYDVIAVGLDVGEGKDLEFVRDKALQVGAVQSYTVDAKKEFAEDYALTALQAHALYEGKYPLVSALSRPLISKKLVEIAEQVGADAVAHGCTGKGNDQVRFEVSIQALNPDLEVMAPVRDWAWSRDEEIDFAKHHEIPVPVDHDSPYSIDQNLWGRSNECGILEDPWVAPPEDAYDVTTPIEHTPDQPETIELGFEQGVPVSLNGQSYELHELILALNELAGKHGVGRIDHVENRLVGIKSREVYECPAAMTLIKAHKELEDITQPKEVAHFKPVVEKKLTELIYEGLWFSALQPALQAFLKETQKSVTGTVRVKLFKGHAVVEGRKSEYSLYNEKLATYTPDDEFDHEAAKGFTSLWGLPTKVHSMVNNKKVNV
ncbi:MAG TPA: argininosuccinate synthase [Bacillales bacterium]|nr:argininosuccinate synthase [Bacillales bacterium]